VLGALSPSGEERKSPALFQPATLSTKQSALESPQVVNKVAIRKFPTETQKDSTFPKFESKPQSQEVTEDQVVKFRCEGKSV
jgi:myosin-light-chain kinase